MKTNTVKIKQYSIVKLVPDWNPYPFDQDQTFVFFGEIPNMKGHCVVCDHKTGKVYSGYHIERFVALHPDET